MDEQQERDFYEQQKNMPRISPTYNPIWSSSLASSKSKSTKWFARVVLVFFLVPFTILLGGIVKITWDLFNVQSIEEKEYSAPR
ncbi:hypothetical protein PMIT1342_00914 [Prochlorococcus marinus str. MIT 1342]|uniref:hypothetical protein n=1 Tax=Prochlorococcus TaxID=1218 RepID=UPI0007B33C2D|nr:hypothetical protein [Prochlorococcus marinus]KZR82444.1 hypothetical protein PMIT1342_00914 [Prochlorococcus marinus str. MIT 1342]